jgi:hypothetical protein
MKIGLISDTHGYLDPQIFNYFDACDEIWHAGDIGSEAIIDDLEQFKPLKVVWGNIDDHRIRSRASEVLFLNYHNIRIALIHIGATPPKFNPSIRQLISDNELDVLICGHSHICKVQYDPQYKVLYMNPGAAGRHGFHHVRTILRFDINPVGLANLEVIELGPRSLKTKKGT